MSLLKTVEKELAAIKAALAEGPAKNTEARQLLQDLAEKARNHNCPPPRVFSVDELKKAVQHLSFETYHFRCYTELYKNPDLMAFTMAARQAVQYALLLHLRLLINFFYGRANQD